MLANGHDADYFAPRFCRDFAIRGNVNVRTTDFAIRFWWAGQKCSFVPALQVVLSDTCLRQLITDIDDWRQSKFLLGMSHENLIIWEWFAKRSADLCYLFHLTNTPELIASIAGAWVASTVLTYRQVRFHHHTILGSLLSVFQISFWSVWRGT